MLRKARVGTGRRPRLTARLLGNLSGFCREHLLSDAEFAVIKRISERVYADQEGFRYFDHLPLRIPYILSPPVRSPTIPNNFVGLFLVFQFHNIIDRDRRG